jgi:hypothetical protein
MPQVEIFTPDGVVAGGTTRPTLGSDNRGAPSILRVDGSRWYPLDGSAPERRGSVSVSADDQLVVVVPPPAFAVHSSLYPVELEVGPYHLEGRLPTLPGFDPGRALARPNGPFVGLREVTISLIGKSGAGSAKRAYALVNRYAVERVVSGLMLSFFFPGAAAEVLDEHPAVGGPPLVGKPATA